MVLHACPEMADGLVPFPFSALHVDHEALGILLGLLDLAADIRQLAYGPVPAADMTFALGGECDPASGFELNVFRAAFAAGADALKRREDGLILIGFCGFCAHGSLALGILRADRRGEEVWHIARKARLGRRRNTD